MPVNLSLRKTVEQSSREAGRATEIYEVLGLPVGDEIFIRQTDGKWKVLRLRNGVRQSWTEGHDTLEDAFALVRAEYETAE